MKIDAEEKELLDPVERGEWPPAQGGKRERARYSRHGLFPSPKDIVFTCSCPDWASMCKHGAAVLYGIGARLDHPPELLFTLRKVDQQASDQPAPGFSRAMI